MVVAYKEPDPTGVLSPNNSHCLFQVDSLARHRLHLAYNTNIRSVDRTDKICQEIGAFFGAKETKRTTTEFSRQNSEMKYERHPNVRVNLLEPELSF